MAIAENAVQRLDHVLDLLPRDVMKLKGFHQTMNGLRKRRELASQAYRRRISLLLL